MKILAAYEEPEPLTIDVFIDMDDMCSAEYKAKTLAELNATNLINSDITMADFENLKKYKVLGYILKFKDIARKFFINYFQNNIQKFIDLFNPQIPNNGPFLAEIMLEHPCVLQMAVDAIGKDKPEQIAELFKLLYEKNNLILGLVVRSDKMLQLMRYLCRTVDDFLALKQQNPKVYHHISAILSHPEVVEYIASLFRTSEQLIEFRASPYGDSAVHLVYQIVECLARKKMTAKQLKDNSVVVAEQFTVAMSDNKDHKIVPAQASSLNSYSFIATATSSGGGSAGSPAIVANKKTDGHVIQITENDKFLLYFDGYQVIGRLTPNYLPDFYAVDIIGKVNDCLFRECKLGPVPLIEELSSTATAAAGTATAAAPSFKPK